MDISQQPVVVNSESWQQLVPTTKSKSARPSAARIEKGTVKVIPHVEQEKASRLLYALSKILMNDDVDTRKRFFENKIIEIHQVVSNFGLDKTRMEADGKKMVADFVNEASRALLLDAVGTGSGRVNELITDLKKKDEDYVDGIDLAGNATVTDTRSTRNGTARKRQIQELEAVVEKMKDDVKKVKAMDESDRRRS